MLDDLKKGDTLKARYPDRLLRIRYEDLAMAPLKFAEALVKFTGLQMTPELGERLLTITSVGAPCHDDYCTSTTDSKKVVMKWRTQLDFRSVEMIDANCGRVYDRLGYFPLRSKQDLLNLSVPYFAEFLDVPGLWE